MTTPILRNAIGSAVARTFANAVANNAYANVADAVRLNPGVSGSNHLGALLADFRLTSVTFASAPVVGALQLIRVDRDFAGNIGPTPSATLLGTPVGTFSPQPTTSNASTGWIMGLDNVALTPDADYWLLNNGTAVSLNSGCVLTAQCWSPGA